MIGDSIIVNGRLDAPTAATFTLDDTDATYGYGCYETLKAREGVLYFPEFHEERLLRSASILGIRHGLEKGELVSALRVLLNANGLSECNIKVMMIGHDGRDADWYAFLLPPALPPPSAYLDGVPCLLFRGERHFPRAKSLSMLLSTVAYRAAGARGCYDALLVNGRGEITEGTRTNAFYVRSGDSGVAYTPPAADVLEGITRKTLIVALAEAGVRTIERPLPAREALGGTVGLMVTSTSSRVIPVRALFGAGDTFRAEGAAMGENPTGMVLLPEMERVRSIYDEFLARYSDSRGA